MTKEFSLLQLFSLVDGRLSTTMEDVYNMLNHITDTELMTHHLPVAMDYVKNKNPKWFQDAKKLITGLVIVCPEGTKAEKFDWMMVSVNHFNKYYDIPQLKDEFDVLDFEKFMFENSLLLK